MILINFKLTLNVSIISQDFQVLSNETNDSSSSSSSSSSMSSKNIRPLPPKSLKIIRKVSCDSLLIGWQTHNMNDDILGYQVC